MVRRVDGDLTIVGNAQLSDCAVATSLIRATRGSVRILGNAPGCDSEEEATSSRTMLATQSDKGSAEVLDVPGELLTIEAFPNPMTQWLQVRVPQSAMVQLYNALGVLVGEYSVDHSAQIDVSTYPAGIYMLRTAGASPTRLIKQ